MVLRRRGGQHEVAAAAPDVLELRVHGVDNTPPHGMLEVAPDDVEKVRGDSLGSFWTLSEDALTHARGVPPTHHDHVPAGVRREAYSWGAMARFSPSAPGGVGRAVVSALSRAGWLLLLPLGLANVAYWSRAIPGEQQHGRGARSVRVFSLGLSLLVVTAVSAVSLDLVGTQCLRDGPGGAEVVCEALPAWLRWLTEFPWSQRLALLAVAPIAALLVLRWLASASRMRYEQLAAGRGAPQAHAADAGAPADRPVLARPELWSRWVLARTMANLHVAAGLALVVGTLSWTQVYTGDEDCHSAVTWFQDPYCRPGVTGAFADSPGFAALLVLALLLAGVAAWRVAVARHDDMPPHRAATPASQLILVAGVALFGACAAALWFADPPAQAPKLLALEATPGLLVALLLAVALAGLGWRRPALSLIWIALVGVALVALALGALPRVPGGVGSWLTVDPLPLALAGFVVLALVSLARRGPAPPRPAREQAWGGAGPGIFLLLSLGTSMLLSALAVVAVGDWLNGTSAARCLAPGPDGGPGPGCEAAGASAAVAIPTTYTEFAVATVVALGVLALLLLGTLGLTAALALRRGRTPIPASPAGEPEQELQAAAAEAAEVLQPAGRLADLSQRPGLAARVQGVRRLAALSHRAELFLGFAATGFGVALALTLFASVDGTGPGWQLPGGLIGLGLWATALLWTALLVRVVTASEDVVGRPLAMLWDLVGFLPRSAHPFGPPCYAERAVPELAARMDAWLRGDDIPRRPHRWTREERERVARRRVVLSAHSLGAVLAVAALFTAEADGATAAGSEGEATGRRRAGGLRDGRVGLLTYGTQLRAYFGRIFPELLGPQVLGTAPCRGTAPLSGDPWRHEVDHPPDPAIPAVAGPSGTAAGGAGGAPSGPGRPATSDTLCARLGGGAGTPPAWVSLWRRTDYIGMPVASYAPNLIDRGAEELDATAFVPRVATHSGYARTAAYRRAVHEVLGRLGRASARR